MTILNRRQFMQLLAGTAMAATVPLPPLPDAPAYSPSRDMMDAGKLMAQGFIDGPNGALTVVDIMIEAGGTRFDFSSGYPREIPDWSSQIVTVHGFRDSNHIRHKEEYVFVVESSEMPTGGWDEILEFVEGKLTPEHLVMIYSEPIPEKSEGFRYLVTIN